MESNQEEPKTYRSRTGSIKRRKTLPDAPVGAEKPSDADEPAPRERQAADEQPAKRAPTRQSFFKNRATQSEPRDANSYDGKPRRAAPRGRDAGERQQKSSGFEKFRREKPRSERRAYTRDRDRDRDRPDDGRPYARKPYRDEEPRSRRAAKAYGERVAKPRREKPFGDYAQRSVKPRTAKKPAEKIQVTEPNMPVRLNKFIANSGVCSRREADEYIQKGEVTVNGKVVTELGTKVLLTDEIRWNGDKLSGEKKVYIVLNKPKGYVTTVEDPHASKTVMDLIAGACAERVYPVGRLDKNTTGVLLFTNDGELTKTLTHPSYSKRKVYQVTLDKTLKKPDMEKLVEGVELEDGVAAADEVGYTNMEDKTEVGLEIHSGRNRVVRRMFEALGYEVKKLDRAYFAGLTKKSIERGQWRFLSPKEVSILKMGAYE
jgi:23S rRNA pseudouridine2605 synthase